MIKQLLPKQFFSSQHPGIIRPVYWSGRLLAGFLLVFLLLNLLTMRIVVEGSSMEPSFENGQMLLVSRVHPLLEWFSRGQVVVLRIAGSPLDYVKRLIGLPGETIEIRDQVIYVDGQLLDEPYLLAGCSVERCPDSFWQLGKDEYFVLGDNRNVSDDSRVFGIVQQSQLIGVALFRYWPIRQWGWINQTGS